MIKLIAIVGNKLQTFNKPSTTSIHAKSILLIRLKSNWSKLKISLSLTNQPTNKFPESVLEIVAKIEEADGVIIGTPEYDHSIPAVLMSALAWLSYGIFPLLNKPVMITGASYGTLGSSRAQLQLRQILNAPEIKANVLPDEFLLSHSFKPLIKMETWWI